MTKYCCQCGVFSSSCSGFACAARCGGCAMSSADSVSDVADLFIKTRRLRRGVERILLRRGLPRSADVAIALAVIRQRPDPSFRQRNIRRLADADANPLPARSGAERIPADQQRRESVWLVLFHHKVRRARGRHRARPANSTPQNLWGVFLTVRPDAGEEELLGWCDGDWRVSSRSRPDSDDGNHLVGDAVHHDCSVCLSRALLKNEDDGSASEITFRLVDRHHGGFSRNTRLLGEHRELFEGVAGNANNPDHRYKYQFLHRFSPSQGTGVPCYSTTTCEAGKVCYTRSGHDSLPVFTCPACRAGLFFTLATRTIVPASSSSKSIDILNIYLRYACFCRAEAVRKRIFCEHRGNRESERNGMYGWLEP
ncbi:MAG: hypothetical protein KatS3mg100_505 [Candidatus Parcubacteria bacterium]|nr:MAG: hypothetical protein KatS3mg100_505 [Candidatus Parcubacteria bacterium]